MNYDIKDGNYYGSVNTKFQFYNNNKLKIIINLDDLGQELVYTALTRLRLGMNSKCHINIICSDPALKSYGETWDEDFYNLL